QAVVAEHGIVASAAGHPVLVALAEHLVVLAIAEEQVSAGHAVDEVIAALAVDDVASADARGIGFDRAVIEELVGSHNNSHVAAILEGRGLVVVELNERRV